MAHQVAPRAEADLEDIWLYVAQDSGRLEVANRLIDSITDRFFLLADFPYAGRARDREFGPGMRSFPVGEFVIVYQIENKDILILRVVHGRRDLGRLFGISPG
jgi:toxin ParE1/3/4